MKEKQKNWVVICISNNSPKNGFQYWAKKAATCRAYKSLALQTAALWFRNTNYSQKEICSISCLSDKKKPYQPGH
jgi:hypothetical protein